VARILVVEDNAPLREAIAVVLRSEKHDVGEAESAEAALAACAAGFPDVIVTDLRLPGQDGIALLREMKGRDPLIEVLLLTAYGTVEAAVEAMRAGAFDFLTKPVRMDQLAAKVDAARRAREDRLALRRERERREYLEEEIGAAFNAGQIVGRSRPMQELFATLEKVARTDSSVLITGESGTGKELVARAIHVQSRRRTGPFVRVSCGALPEGVLESELFGHERGAFTGALRQRRGRFELAEGGTLFLDEIADIGGPVQVRLLQVLQEREFERVGGEETVRADVRVIAATNRTIREEVAAGRFREDLFYRLYVIPIHLPPLRQRKEDIPLLVDHFVRKHAQRTGQHVEGLEPGARERLLAYHWPGNVRELENTIERAVVLASGPVIGAAAISIGEPPVGPAARGLPSARLHENVEWAERESVERALRQAQGVKKDAAEVLGISQRALSYYLGKYKIE
jgi:DNA-binding NtrC family response regulator